MLGAIIGSMLASLVLAGCGDDSCGPDGAPATGLVASAQGVTLTYGGLSSLAGNDCNDPAAPGVISVSIRGMQIDGAATGVLTLCIPRPDLLMDGPRTLGLVGSTADIRIIAVEGTVDGEGESCSFALDQSRPPTGQGTATGVCASATDPAGFALELDGAVTLERTCGGNPKEQIPVTLRGRVEVAFRAE